jgi:hypothetical protein
MHPIVRPCVDNALAIKASLHNLIDTVDEDPPLALSHVSIDGGGGDVV